MIATPTVIQSIGAALFVIALVHTFSTKYFERLAHQRPDHAGIYHLLGEVEIVFGVWAGALILAMMLVAGRDSATTYLDSRDFTEPLFVFAIMVIAGSRPILELANAGVRVVAGSLPMAGAPAMYFTVLAFVPLLGSFITEPAAMTLAALILRERFFAAGLSNRLKYATRRHPLREHLDRRHAHLLRRAAGPHGGGQVGLGHGLHDEHLRLAGGRRGAHQRARS